MEDALIRDPEGGGNQSGLRDRNARLVLSYVRRHGAMASAEIARRSGLSAQTVSNIVRALEAEGLIAKGEAVKGKVGKPSVPVRLNPTGVHSLGLSLGRRSAELVLVDFTGKRLAEYGTTYPYPTPEAVFPFLAESVAAARKRVPETAGSLVGIGVAMPFRLWEWHQLVGAPEEALNAWRSLDVGARAAEIAGVPAIIENDATSACIAEHLIGQGHAFSDYAYLFVGAFIGGGLVLNGTVFRGRTGNAGAYGPLPVPTPEGGTTQLLNVASLQGLEAAIRDAGGDPESLRHPEADWHEHGATLDDWITVTARNLAIAAAATSSVVDVEAVLVDGAMPRWVTEELVARMNSAFEEIDMTGIVKPEILRADVGRGARSVGAALLPIHARYFMN